MVFYLSLYKKKYFTRLVIAISPKNISRIRFDQLRSAYTRIPNNRAAIKFENPYIGPVDSMYPQVLSA